jgi:hypothetical protein
MALFLDRDVAEFRSSGFAHASLALCESHT